MPCVFSGEYHDAVWGTPVLDSTNLFANLSLCTQQCGVSWRIVWNKRHHYRDAFRQWDMRQVAAMGEEDLDALVDKEGPWKGKLIQNRAKLSAIIHNARQCLAIEEETPGGLSAFLWRTVASGEAAQASSFELRLAGLDAPLRLDPRAINAAADHSSDEYQEVFGVTGEFSDLLAARLKRSGEHKRELQFEPFKFLGSTTLQAFMLQCGILNGHSPCCFKNPRSSHAHCGKSTPARSARSDGEPMTAPRSSKRRRAAQDLACASTDDVWL